MQSSNKTGLVLKISLVLFLLLATVVYKLNDYFRNEKLYTAEAQVRNKVILAKTTVSSQLAQLKNTLSSYETELDDLSINWVQLDPFFALARIDNVGPDLKVNQMLVRSNTPAERWNAVYLEKALLINKSKQNKPVLVQLFQDKTGSKFLIIRFKTNQHKELVVVGLADYFQKFFDIERGENGTALLATTENILAAHSEGDYIATQTQETKISKKKYLFEKEEIVGTNLIAMNYVLKNKIAAGFVVPWSIIGVVAGVGCILIAILFYSLDPIERKVERYKRQERAQIYKDTLGSLVNKATAVNLSNSVLPPALPPGPGMGGAEKTSVDTKAVEKKQGPPKGFYSIDQAEKEVTVATADSQSKEEVTKTAEINLNTDQFLALDHVEIDLSDIEKALALDDFDGEEPLESTSAKRLKENLTSQKISISPIGAPIEKPRFAVQRKEFNVDEFKINIRRPAKWSETL